MVNLLIIADDFTGAIDAGAQFASAGIPARVVVTKSIPTASDQAGFSVLSIDAETRHLPADEAYSVTRTLAEEAIRLGIPLLMKKVDSTLRGQVGSELSALSDAAGGAEVAFLPAFPEAGRTTENGIQLLNGVPVHETEFHADPFEPVLHSSIAETIHSQSDIDVESVCGNVKSCGEQHRRVAVYDSKTRESMAETVRQLYNSGTRLWGGCAGLAKALAECMQSGEKLAFKPRTTEGIFVACGSLNPIAYEQMQLAAKNGFELFALTDTQKLQPDFLNSSFGNELLARLRAASLKTGRVILTAAGGAVEAAQTCSEAFGFSQEEARVLISRRIGELVQAWMCGGYDHTIIATGGDTLFALMQQLGITSLSPICELEAGVVCSEFLWQERSWQLVSKAGGYGAADMIVKLANQLIYRPGINDGGQKT